MKIELDVKIVFGLIVEEYNSNLYHASLILDCKTLINQIPQVKISHCFYEANKCADASVRKGPALDRDLMYFDSSSVDLYLLLFYNNMGLYHEKHSHLNFIVVDSVR